MASPRFILTSLLLLILITCSNLSSASPHNHTLGISMPSHPLSFSSVDSPCDFHHNHHHNSDDKNPSKLPPTSTLKLHLKHRAATECDHSRKQSMLQSAHRDISRIQTLFTPITHQNKSQKPNTNTAPAPNSATPELAGRLMATLESGVSLGSGEYFVDVFIGTPPRHMSLILDTGSDLNWIQCLPCHDCFDQHGPFYDPAIFSSFAVIRPRRLQHHCGRCGAEQ